MNSLKVIVLVILSGVATGIGAFFGSSLSYIFSQKVISLCLAFAAGAMLYVVTGELLPEANKLYEGRMSAIGNILGFLIRNNCCKNIKKKKQIYYFYLN